jgi:Glycosyl hydrolases family 43
MIYSYTIGSLKNLVMRVLVLLVILISGLSTQGQTSFTHFHPGELWTDNDDVHINAHGGGFLFHGDTYYWFGEHKISGAEGNKSMVGIHVYSSKDLYNWKDEGIALKMHEDTISLFQRGCVVERPKVIFNKKTKKFVMWFHHELKDQGYKAALTGVAISDHIKGPYKYIKSMRLHPNILPANFTKEQMEIAELIQEPKPKNIKEKVTAGSFFKRDFKKGQMSRDMTLFVDEDEAAYHVTASEENNTLLISRLSEDYLSFSGEYVRVFPGGRNEAPAIFKNNGKYYMFTSDLTGWTPNPGRLSVSSGMMEGWTSLGNPCRGSDEENSTTFWSQSTYVIPVQGKKDAYIFAADRWRPDDPIDGRYIWLPIEFENEHPIIRWHKSWDLSIFDK